MSSRSLRALDIVLALVLLAPVIADLGLECLGVEYSPSHGNSLVRVYIDAADRPVTVDDCEIVSRQVSATLRSSSDVGRRGGEVAAGVRIQPVAGIPLWIDAERRQRIGRYGGGRSAFALFFEGGVYDRPMPMRFLLDAYLQGGVVGFHSRDRFIDGGLTLTRPVYKQFSAGLGVWGGAQPGLYRVDAGPRVTMQVRKNLRVHLDWRQRLAGNAQPGSGPAITLAGDF